MRRALKLPVNVTVVLEVLPVFNFYPAGFSGKFPELFHRNFSFFSGAGIIFPKGEILHEPCDPVLSLRIFAAGR